MWQASAAAWVMVYVGEVSKQRAVHDHPLSVESQKTDSLQHHDDVGRYAFPEKGRTKRSPTVAGREFDNAAGLVVLVARDEDSLKEGVSPSCSVLSPHHVCRRG